MPAVGTLVIVLGLWLLSSAVKNRRPIETLKQIIGNPRQLRGVLDESAGTGFLGDYEAVSGFVSGGNVSGGGSGGGGGSWVTGTTSTRASAAISFARAQLGKPYRWGATGPAAYDCSGLVMMSYRNAGYSLPRTTTLMQADPRLRIVQRAELIPGDLVFPNLTHVGIYVGGGRIIEAPQAGKVVREGPMWGFLTARRIP